MGIIGLLRAIFQIAFWYLKGKPERERIKNKEQFDKAIALLFSKLHDRKSNHNS